MIWVPVRFQWQSEICLQTQCLVFPARAQEVPLLSTVMRSVTQTLCEGFNIMQTLGWEVKDKSSSWVWKPSKTDWLCWLLNVKTQTSVSQMTRKLCLWNMCGWGFLCDMKGLVQMLVHRSDQGKWSVLCHVSTKQLSSLHVRTNIFTFTKVVDGTNRTASFRQSCFEALSTSVSAERWSLKHRTLLIGGWEQPVISSSALWWEISQLSCFLSADCCLQPFLKQSLSPCFDKRPRSPRTENMKRVLSDCGWASVRMWMWADGKDSPELSILQWRCLSHSVLVTKPCSSWRPKQSRLMLPNCWKSEGS